MFRLKQKAVIMSGLLLLLSFIGCNSDKQWIEKSYYEDGTLKSEVEMVGDERHGEYKEYYRTGELLMFTEYRNGKRHGWQQSYYQNGQKRLEAEFVDGQPGDYSITYKPNGDTVSFYKEGRAIDFFDNGKIEQIICSQNHELNSISSIRFNPGGEILKRDERLYCLTGRDSVLLDEQYPQWKTGKVVERTSDN
jgi:antitoxin component YwqK of YwqJK toxin-antitoxin module